MSPLTKNYAHRPNEDGTYDSICPTCARTVAEGISEMKLAETQTVHQCPGLPASLVDHMERESGTGSRPSDSAARAVNLALGLVERQEERLRAIVTSKQSTPKEKFRVLVELAHLAGIMLHVMADAEEASDKR